MRFREYPLQRLRWPSYEIAKRVPIGRNTTYGAIAKALGAARSSRLVRMAMILAYDRRHVFQCIMVNRNDVLTDKQLNDTPGQMQELLEEIGVRVADDQVQDFQLWDPLTEL